MFITVKVCQNCVLSEGHVVIPVSACLLFYFIFLNTLVLKSRCVSRPPRDQLTITDGLTSGELSSSCCWWWPLGCLSAGGSEMQLC